MQVTQVDSNRLFYSELPKSAAEALDAKTVSVSDIAGPETWVPEPSRSVAVMHDLRTRQQQHQHLAHHVFAP
jgi:hypothetical protein